MLSKSLVAATLALAVSAQTSTSCSPLKQDCPPDAAVGKKGINCDFTKGACDAFVSLAGKGFTYGANGAAGEMSGIGQAPTLQSKETIFFGRMEVEMQAAPGAGIVSSIVLLSADLDEIDLEAVGSDNVQIQSNTFSKGDDSKHDLLGMLPVNDLTGAMHKYTVDWTTDRIEFYVDGSLKRTLRRADIPDRYPQTPMYVKVGAWVPGYPGNAPGTISWAGGLADFSHPHTSYFKSITVTDYAGGSSATSKDVKEYVYGDRSGSSGSIQIHLADGSSSTGDSPSTGGSGSSSSSSTPSSTPSSTATTTTETTKSSTTESKTTTSTTETPTPTTTTHTKTNSTMTHTTMTTTTSGDGSSTVTQTTTVSAPPTTPSTGAAAGLTIGAGLAIAAALFAL